jgi:hypothetical protein
MRSGGGPWRGPPQAFATKVALSAKKRFFAHLRDPIFGPAPGGLGFAIACTLVL